ncbi:MAG TPA: PPOX class F420-dependent oxidoreductase [Streptosporangiaceae bacterium]|jgi:pyridoxamine 5'-phosphate oxidase family protein|nr:PPOX class F420-dependent oxidoreductase [Streptosporangiaceae bacterium]
MTLSDAEQHFLAEQRLGRLATVAPGGFPQVKPVGLTYNDRLGTIDIYGLNMAGSAKYRNVRHHPEVAIVVDVPGSGPGDVRFLEVRGRAETATAEAAPFPGADRDIIRIHPRRVLALNVDPGQDGLQARDVGAAI